MAPSQVAFPFCFNVDFPSCLVVVFYFLLLKEDWKSKRKQKNYSIHHSYCICLFVIPFFNLLHVSGYRLVYTGVTSPGTFCVTVRIPDSLHPVEPASAPPFNRQLHHHQYQHHLHTVHSLSHSSTKRTTLRKSEGGSCFSSFSTFFFFFFSLPICMVMLSAMPAIRQFCML